MSAQKVWPLLLKWRGHILSPCGRKIPVIVGKYTACEAFHSIIMLFPKGQGLGQIMPFGYVEDPRGSGELAR